KLCVVPKTRAPLHQVAVIVCDAFSDPKSTRMRRPREIPRTQLNRPQTLYVPHVKEFVRGGGESFFKLPWIGELAGQNDLRRRQVFHPVARVAVVRGVNEESGRLKFRPS